MPTPTTAQDRIATLQAEIQQLKESAISELKVRRSALEQELRAVEAELASLTGKQPEGKTKYRRSEIIGRTPSLAELKELLATVPGNILNLRKEAMDVKHVKGLAKENFSVLKMGGKGPWPTVMLVK